MWTNDTLIGTNVLSYEVKPIFRSDKEKELVWRHPEDKRKLVVKNFCERFVKNAFCVVVVNSGVLIENYVWLQCV